jgi:hypothetical protein
MAAHIDTVTMADPRSMTRNLDHLGLGSEIYDELAIGIAPEHLNDDVTGIV